MLVLQGFMSLWLQIGAMHMTELAKALGGDDIDTEIIGPERLSVSTIP